MGSLRMRKTVAGGCPQLALASATQRGGEDEATPALARRRQQQQTIKAARCPIPANSPDGGDSSIGQETSQKPIKKQSNPIKNPIQPNKKPRLTTQKALLSHSALWRLHARSRVPVCSPQHRRGTDTGGAGPAQRLRDAEGPGHTRPGPGNCRCAAGRREGAGLALRGALPQHSHSFPHPIPPGKSSSAHLPHALHYGYSGDSEHQSPSRQKRREGFIAPSLQPYSLC